MTTLSDAQESLRQTLIAAAIILRNTGRRFDNHPMGTLIQPAHTIENGTISVPERRYNVEYISGYGVVAPRLCTSNGSAWMIAACVRDDTRWEPVSE